MPSPQLDRRLIIMMKSENDVDMTEIIYPRQMPFRVDPSPHNFNWLSSSPPPPPHPPIGDLKVFYNTRFKGVLLRVENINFFLPIYPKICWCQQVVYYFFGRS